jgi:signal transduction histidine kinase
MLRFKSIFARIIFLHAIAVVTISVAILLALYWLLGAATNRLHHEAMLEQAESISHWLVERPDGSLALELPESLRDLYSTAYGRYQYAIMDDAGRVLFSSRNNAEPIFSPATSFPEGLRERKSEDGSISGVSIPKRVVGQRLSIQVAENLAHRDVIIDDIVGDFFKRVGWITWPMLCVLLAVDIVIFRRALRPLIEASERARNIGPNRTDVRLPIERIPTEVQPLVSAVNQALDRLAAGYQRQREFTADAAHELRTPLAILRTRLDTMGDRELTKAVRQDIEGMCRIVSQLLESAELDTFVIDASERADLHAICAEVAEFVVPLAMAQGKDVALEAADEPVWIRGNAEMLYRAVRNLGENAINHSPQGTTVEITVSKDGTVVVADHGPGIQEVDRQFLFRRFWRRDRQAGGAGLGLSIVRRIAEAHAASITVENKPSGGARFSLRLEVCRTEVQPNSLTEDRTSASAH